MRKFYIYFWAAACVPSMLVLEGCQNLPGTSKQQGAAIGGVGGAVAGAAVGGEHHRLLGAILGGALGAGGGYVVGANSDRLTGNDTTAATEATQRAQAQPASPQEALHAPTADLNGDGFVTLDEVVALREAGLSDQVILERLRATGQVFELTNEQQNYLRTRGLSSYVVAQMTDINRDVKERLSGNQSVISRPTASP